MRAKDFLNNLGRLENLINYKTEEIHRLRELAMSISIKCDEERVSSSGVSDKVGGVVTRYLALEEELEEEILAFEKERRIILKVLDVLPMAENQVLWEIYVNNKSYYEVMDSLDRSRSWVRNHHSNGLKAVQKIIDEEEGRWQSLEQSEQEQSET